MTGRSFTEVAALTCDRAKRLAPILCNAVVRHPGGVTKHFRPRLDPHGKYHVHTGRYLAKHLGYDDELVASLPDVAVESFAGVSNPFSLQTLANGEHVVDVGSGGAGSIRLSQLIRLALTAKSSAWT